MDSEKSLASLWLANKLPAKALTHIHLPPHANTVNSSFQLGSAAQTSIGLSALSAAHLHSVRNGSELDQEVIVDARHAVLEFHSQSWYTIDGKLPGQGKNIWDRIAGLYHTKDSGFVRIHTNFPHHRHGVLSILQIEDTPSVTREVVAEALLKWDAIEFENEAAARGMCVTAFRSFDQWDIHPQALALQNTPSVQIIKIADSPKRSVESGRIRRPLDGIRVLDLTRVLAGPVCGRTLAYHGADVLLVTSPHLPALPLLDMDTSRGKRTTQLDLTQESDRASMVELIKEADVFTQAYKPGTLASKGFSVDEVVRIRPGIVYASLNAWGWEGPWKDRRGFDSLVQTATGFNHSEGEFYSTYTNNKSEPRPLPCQALDHAAGYLLAFGINTALSRTVTEGGSYEVKVSLAAVGQWIRAMGRINPEEAFGKGRPLPGMTIPQDKEVNELCSSWIRERNGVAVGSMTAIRHAGILSKTPVKEGNDSKAPAGLDAHGPKWLSTM